MRTWVYVLTTALICLALFSIGSTVALYNEITQLRRAIVGGSASLVGSSIGLPSAPTPGIGITSKVSAKLMNVQRVGTKVQLEVLIQSTSPIDLMGASTPLLYDQRGNGYAADAASLQAVRQGVLDMASLGSTQLGLVFPFPVDATPVRLVFNGGSTSALAPEIRVDLAP